MSRIITFSRYFPAYHPRKGELTNFVEQIWNSLNELKLPVPKNKDLPHDFMWSILPLSNFGTKHHTIRAGNRWEVGDKFSPRVWSGKPYQSKQIILAPDIEIKKVWNFKMVPALWEDECKFYLDEKHLGIEIIQIAYNDGLEPIDFMRWFTGSGIASSKRAAFQGQIICWNENIIY